MNGEESSWGRGVGGIGEICIILLLSSPSLSCGGATTESSCPAAKSFPRQETSQEEKERSRGPAPDCLNSHLENALRSVPGGSVPCCPPLIWLCRRLLSTKPSKLEGKAAGSSPWPLPRAGGAPQTCCLLQKVAIRGLAGLVLGHRPGQPRLPALPALLRQGPGAGKANMPGSSSQQRCLTSRPRASAEVGASCGPPVW